MPNPNPSSLGILLRFTKNISDGYLIALTVPKSLTKLVYMMVCDTNLQTCGVVIK